MPLTALLAAETGQTNELPAPAEVIGLIALGLLLTLLVGVLAFGKGRPHS